MKLAELTLLSALSIAMTGCNSDNTTESSRTSQNPISTVPETGAAVNGNSIDNSGNELPGTTNPLAPVYIDPLSPDFQESNITHFRPALLGAWAGSDCNESEDPDTGAAQSYRSVFVFTDEEMIETEYTYPSNDCSGIPQSKWYPLPIRSWQLGDYRTLLDGSGAWELDTTITQRGVYYGAVGDDIGTNSYVNIGFVNGNLEFNTLTPNYKHTRPAGRSALYFKRIPAPEASSINAESLIGTWFSSCSGTLESTYEFYPDTLVVTDENWANTGCEGDSYASRQTTFSIQYGTPFVSIFQDNLLAVELQAISNVLLHFDETQELDQPEFKVQEGKVEYRAMNVQGNSLILGYCLHRNSGEDDCQDSLARQPDMVDYNWFVRFKKII